MDPFAVATITFVFTFVGAWVSMVVGSALPPSNLSKESEGAVRLGMGLVATMTALLLGLVTAAAKTTFDSQDETIRSSAVNILTLDRDLARYGPETATIRDLLRRTLAARVEATWPANGGPPSTRDVSDAPSGAEDVQNRILALSPVNDTQQWLKADALKLTDEVVKARWRLLGAGAAPVPRAFLAVVIFWLTATFASFGLFAPRNGTVLSVLFIASLSVAAAVFLILELDGPFDGVIKIASSPMRYALAHLGK